MRLLTGILTYRPENILDIFIDGKQCAPRLYNPDAAITKAIIGEVEIGLSHQEVISFLSLSGQRIEFSNENYSIWRMGGMTYQEISNYFTALNGKHVALYIEKSNG